MRCIMGDFGGLTCMKIYDTQGEGGNEEIKEARRKKSGRLGFRA